MSEINDSKLLELEELDIQDILIETGIGKHISPCSRYLSDDLIEED